MKNFILIIFLLFSSCLFAQNQDFSNNRLIVQLKKNDSRQIKTLNELKSLRFLYQNNLIKEVKPLDISSDKSLNGRPLVIIFNEAIDIEKTIKKLNETQLFDRVEPDFISRGSGVEKRESNLLFDKTENKLTQNSTFLTTPNDMYFFRQWGLNNNGTFSLSPATVDADVDMPEAWDITTGSSSVSIAIIDSGIRMTHPEFSGRFLNNTVEQTANGVDDDNNGYIDDYRGWDFVNNDNNPTDDHGHGTNVTGIAVATGNNAIGYAGVDWNCKFIHLKTLNANNSGYTSDMVAAIYYAVNRGVNVISMSIGGTGFSTIYQDAVNYAYNHNIALIACMANTNSNTIYYPAAFANSIAVGSTDPDDKRSNPFFWSATSGSNYGSHIDVVAPGNYIYGLSHTSNTDYSYYWGGTSQATPLVAGIATLMLAIKPDLTVDEIRAILRNTAQDQVGNPTEDTPGWDQYYGSGRVNAYAALSYTQSLNNTSFENETNLLLFPNPCKDILHISLPNNSTEIKNITIFDISGRLISEIKNNTTNINVSHLQSGTYLLEITTSTGAVLTKKLIKN